MVFVRTLIGREAGTIIDLPFHAAEACKSVGTAVAVTDEEIAEAGLAPAVAPDQARAEEMPRGYTVKIDEEVGGFYAVDAGGVALNHVPLPNLAAVRSLAHAHADPDGGGLGQPEPDKPVLTRREELMELTRATLDKLAGERKLDISKAKNKGDVIDVIIAAEEAEAAAAAAKVVLADLSKDELIALAAERNVDLTDAETEADMIAALELAEEAKA